MNTGLNALTDLQRSSVGNPLNPPPPQYTEFSGHSLITIENSVRDILGCLLAVPPREGKVILERVITAFNGVTGDNIPGITSSSNNLFTNSYPQLAALIRKNAQWLKRDQIARFAFGAGLFPAFIEARKTHPNDNEKTNVAFLEKFFSCAGVNTVRQHLIYALESELIYPAQSDDFRALLQCEEINQLPQSSHITPPVVDYKHLLTTVVDQLSADDLKDLVFLLDYSPGEEERLFDGCTSTADKLMALLCHYFNASGGRTLSDLSGLCEQLGRYHCAKSLLAPQGRT